MRDRKPVQPEAAAPMLYLASQSPRRLQLLTQWGVTCELLLPDATEDAESLEAVKAGESPRRYVQRVTRLKLLAALQRLQRRGLPPAPVLCADTTVALGDRILGKPASADEARSMLAALSGRTHKVYTSVAVGVIQKTELSSHIYQALSASKVTFSELTPDAIDRYVATGESVGKAGAYGIQGLAALWTSRIDGSYSGIMGLPAFETAQVLQQAGLHLV
ncbi:MAG TPA: Maf family protein [Burkholderiaceae bacterium]|nr:Maf family protein [Burkholderiaceae bacterium]